ncbi:hypothetical protein A2U01_0110038, partial [Trifolium medium]|nr:hypothetical protein [Trifolium medium]
MACGSGVVVWWFRGGAQGFRWWWLFRCRH